MSTNIDDVIVFNKETLFSQTVFNFFICISIILVKILSNDASTPNRISVSIIVLKLLIFIKLRLIFTFSDNVVFLVSLAS